MCGSNFPDNLQFFLFLLLLLAEKEAWQWMEEPRNATSWLDAFCGETYWDEAAMAEYALPVVSTCFAHTTLVWLPCLFLVALAPVLTAQIVYERAPPLPWTRPITAKMVSFKNISNFSSDCDICAVVRCQFLVRSCRVSGCDCGDAASRGLRLSRLAWIDNGDLTLG